MTLIPAKKLMSRRALMKSVGAGAVLAPFLPAQLAHAAAPKRLIVWWTPNGVFNPELTPDGAGTQFTFRRILAPLERYKQRMLVLKQLDLRCFFEFPIPNNHGEPLSQTLCAARVVHEGADSWLAEGPSIDQYVARRMNRPGSFDGLNVCAGAYPPHSRVSYRGPRDPITPQDKPEAVFDSLFGGVTDATGTSMEQLRARRKSAIDLVRAELETLARTVGADDRRKLEAHLEHLRAQELRNERVSAGPGCAAPPRPVAAQPAYVVNGRQMVASLFTALRCDLTRVATFIWGGPTSGEVFTWAGVTKRHHDLSHFFKPQPGTLPYEQLTAIGQWQAGELKAFLDLLDSVPEDGGTMLDNSIVLWTTEHRCETGAHERDDVPFVVVGSAGGALRTGQLLQLGGRAHADLYVTLCQALGFRDVVSFGAPEVCGGPIPGLLAS